MASKPRIRRNEVVYSHLPDCHAGLILAWTCNGMDCFWKATILDRDRYVINSVFGPEYMDIISKLSNMKAIYIIGDLVQ